MRRWDDLTKSWENLSVYMRKLRVIFHSPFEHLVRRNRENASKHILPLYMAQITDWAQRGGWSLRALRT